MYEPIIGINYRAENVTETAKRIRKHIAAEVAAGRLPRATYSVRISRYSGGQSLRVTMADVPFVIVNRAWVRGQVEAPYVLTDERVESPAARLLLGAVDRLVASYNRDASDSSVDYFNVAFYGHVGFDGTFQRAQREAVERQIRAEKTAAAAA